MAFIYDNDKEFIEDLGKFIALKSVKAIEEHGFFSISFSGGSAATKICKALDSAVSKDIEWGKWKIFFCDERFVDLSHPDSNFKAVNEGLILKHPEIDLGNVYTLKYGDSVVEAAADYETKLKNIFPAAKFPNIDLVVLGMGPDGHICSLFPNHPLLDERGKWVAHIEDSPKPPPERITFTLDVVNNANSVVFIATGKAKAENVKKAVEEDPNKNIPASLVAPSNKNLYWFLDKGAGSLLKDTSISKLTL